MGGLSFDQNETLLHAIDFSLPPKGRFGRSQDVHASGEFFLKDLPGNLAGLGKIGKGCEDD